MRIALRHLPLLMLTAALLLGVISCGKDEPRTQRHDTSNHSTPTDTTHNSDTTGHHNNDSTGNHGNDSTPAPHVSITINAPRDYGYMGQTMQLTAVTTGSADAVTWRSTRTTVATVDASGLVQFNNALQDSTTTIIATAGAACDSITLTNRCWSVAAWSGGNWTTPPYLTVHPGDTIILTIVDSKGRPVNDGGFNAGACQWTASSRNADVTTALTAIGTPESDSSQRRWLIAGDAPAGAIITIIALHGDAAASITCAIATH